MTNTSANDRVWRQLVTETTGCKNPAKTDTVQSLWSGFGEVFRVDAGSRKLIVKQVTPPQSAMHPRGWSSDFATERKLKSYEVETRWYRTVSHRCNNDSRVPAFLGSCGDQLHRVLLLEDLDAAGFHLRHESLSPEGAIACIDWLANFHAQFLGFDPEGLWPVGTYWHLGTRPDEFNAMEEGDLKQQAQRIDQVLSGSKHQTLVHGDAKIANFCFTPQGQVAAVDFQYIGGGCGMKDLAYFIGSCFNESDCEAYAPALLDRYFETFTIALADYDRAVEIEREWRELYPLAWTDFYRFLAGWMPTHKKIHRYTRQQAEQTLAMLPSM